MVGLTHFSHIMKLHLPRLLAAAVLAACVSAPAFAATAFAEDESTYTGLYLASGLSEENGVISGWYDAEKTQAEDMDDSMCYAASASNLIAWWQNSEYALASEAPKELDVIWNTFVSNNLIQDAGGSPLSAINWWISGVYTPVRDEAWAAGGDELWDRHYITYDEVKDELSSEPEAQPVTLPNFSTKDGEYFGGYYFDQYGLTQQDLASFLIEAWEYEAPESPDTPEASGTTHHTQTLGDFTIEENEGPGKIYEVDFVEILDGSPIALSVHSENDDPELCLAHALTLWGVEYDEDGNLIQVWLTDSDDYINQIFSVSAVMNKEENRIYLGEWDDDHYNWEGYGENVYIDGVFILDTSVLENWQIVPEPTTATLSLLALAGLAARRRRK